MNFLVAAQCVGNGRAIPREGRWIENDYIKTRKNFLVRPRDCLCLQPIENVRRFKGASVLQAVCFRVANSGSDGLFTLVEPMHVGRARASGVQGKTSNKGKAIEHLR